MAETWDETVDLEEGTPADFDSIVPAWDHTVLEETAEFDSETDGDNDLNAAVGAVKLGTKGFEVTFDDGNVAYGVINATAVNRTQSTIDIWFNPNGFTLQNGAVLTLFYLADGAAALTQTLRLERTGGILMLRSFVLNDSAAYVSTDAIAIEDTGWVHVRVSSRRATAPGANNGFTHLYVDNGTTITHESLTNIDNDTKDWDIALVGMCFTNSGTFGGSYYFDEVRLSESVSPAWITPAAALEGDYGIAWTIEDTTARYGVIDGPDAETQITMECMIDPDGLTMADGDEFYFYVDQNGYILILLNKSGSDYRVRASYMDDAGVQHYTSSYTISDASHTIRVVWKAATGVGENDGWLILYIDDVLQETLTGADNDTRTVNTLFAVAGGLDAGTSGVFFMDYIRWSDELYTIPQAGMMFWI